MVKRILDKGKIKWGGKKYRQASSSILVGRTLRRRHVPALTNHLPMSVSASATSSHLMVGRVLASLPFLAYLRCDNPNAHCRRNNLKL